MRRRGLGIRRGLSRLKIEFDDAETLSILELRAATPAT